MNLLHTLRQTPWLARWSAWLFTLVLLGAGAAPWIEGPRGAICSASSAPSWPAAPNDDGASGVPTDATLHCPLCLSGLAAPWPELAALSVTPARCVQPIARAPAAPRMRAPWHALARAPPPAA